MVHNVLLYRGTNAPRWRPIVIVCEGHLCELRCFWRAAHTQVNSAEVALLPLLLQCTTIVVGLWMPMLPMRLSPCWPGGEQHLCHAELSSSTACFTCSVDDHASNLVGMAGVAGSESYTQHQIDSFDKGCAYSKDLDHHRSSAPPALV